jgi:hypothetical protein
MSATNLKLFPFCDHRDALESKPLYYKAIALTTISPDILNAFIKLERKRDGKINLLRGEVYEEQEVL